MLNKRVNFLYKTVVYHLRKIKILILTFIAYHEIVLKYLTDYLLL